MANMAASYEKVFWRSRASAAFRTGWACLLAGMMVYYSDLHSRRMAFPLFAYVMAVTVVGEASLGEALQSAFCVISGILHGAFPAILVLWVIKPERFSTCVTTVCVAASSFVIVWSNMIHMTSKRVACAQVVMIYVSAFSERESMDPVMYPLRVAATTVIGTACALLALIFPLPRLASYQVRQKGKLIAGLTSEVLRLLVEAFNAKNYEEGNSLRFQAKSLSSAGVRMLNQVEDRQNYLKWEVPGLGCASSVKALSKEFGNLRQSLAGMEMALQCSSTFQIGDALLKGPLLDLTEWTSLALNHAGSMYLSRGNSMPNQAELIVEEVRTGLNSLDEALTALLQRPSDIRKPNMPSSDHSFRCRLPTFFFLFNIKFLCKEAITILCSRGQKLQQVVPPGSQKNESSTPESRDYCRVCAAPVTTISINVDHAPEQATFCKRICQCLTRFVYPIDWNRLIIALKCSLSLGLSVLTGILFNRGTGFWGGIAVAMSLSTSRQATFKLGNVRAQGTVAGSIYGIVARILTQKSILLGAVVLIPWVVFTSFLRQSKMYGYAGGLSAVISAVFILGRKSSVPPSEFAIVRITETLVGIACYIMVELTLQPRRAATVARKELILTLSYLHQYTAAIFSAQIGQHCIHSLPSTLSQLKHKEKAVTVHICRLRKSIEEAKTEPDFWFLPFPATTFSKLLAGVSKISDLLQFSLRAHECIIQSCSSSHTISVESIYDPIRDDLKEFGNRVSPPFQCFAQVLQVKSLIHPKNTFPDLESGSMSRAGDQERLYSLLKSMEEVVADACQLGGGDGSGLNTDLVVALSAVAFCMDNIMNESKEVENCIHELLQWENPWSLIDVWKIHNNAKW